MNPIFNLLHQSDLEKIINLQCLMNTATDVEEMQNYLNGIKIIVERVKEGTETEDYTPRKTILNREECMQIIQLQNNMMKFNNPDIIDSYFKAIEDIFKGAKQRFIS